MHHSLTTIPSCFLLQHVLQSLLASLTDLGPFLHVRFCRSVFVNHYMHTILVFVYQPQTAARHTQWRRYIHRHSFGSEQLLQSLLAILSCFLLQHVLQSLLASLTDLGPFLHVRFCRRRYIHRHSFGSEQLLQSLLAILSCFLLQHVLQSLLASLTDLGPFLHVRFCMSVFVIHYMNNIYSVRIPTPNSCEAHSMATIHT
jgi:hypothetical protein